jgi:hypothetical protein
VAPGQDPTDDGAQEGISFTFDAGYEHLFETDLDGPGEFEVDRYGFRLGVQSRIGRDLELRARVGYQIADYDFSSTPGFAGVDPWDDIHTLSIGAELQWSLTNDWRIFAGPVFGFSREDGADWDDAFTGGGLFGATKIVNEDLVIGGGLVGTSRIEDDVLLVPIIILDWKINETLRLTTQGGVGLTGGTNLELVYTPGGNWEFGFGGQYAYRRFRIDGTGASDDGVGEDKSLPLWARASYRFNPNFSVDLYGGVALAGEVQIEDSGGHNIGDSDYDPAPFAGVAVRISF